MTYKITAKSFHGEVREVPFFGDTAEACAGAMVALTCATNRRAIVRALSGRMGNGLRSFTASNLRGDMLRAEWVR